MEYADDSAAARFLDHRCRVVFSVADVDDDRLAVPAGQRELRGEGATLLIARRMIGVVIEPAFPDGGRPTDEELVNGGRVAQRVEGRRVVWVDARSKADEVRMSGGNGLRASGGV